MRQLPRLHVIAIEDALLLVVRHHVLLDQLFANGGRLYQGRILFNLLDGLEMLLDLLVLHHAFLAGFDHI